MFLGKYKQKRRLGKGAYGEVSLVEDQQGALYALKLISMKEMRKEPYLLDYLQGEIDCMMKVNSPYIMKLYSSEEDENYKYLLCEYCNKGDLLNLQSTEKGKVFALEKAIKIMADVVKGLQFLHEKGYLHRDIKSQNVLVKDDNGIEVKYFDQRQTYKLADFGFSKKIEDVGGTVLGTQTYMSPEIYQNDAYGFEVDMWAFGVLLYFMLNMEFPFKINPHHPIEKKKAQLQRLATNFSYANAVKNSKKKIEANCTKEVEDLFKRMFEPDGDKRITFSEIREHPLFEKHFPIAETHASKILYANKFQSKIIKPAKKDEKKNVNDMEDNIRETMSIIKKPDQKFPKEKLALETKKDEIDFLKDNSQEFFQKDDYFKTEERISLSYNLLKYYIILLRKFIDNLTPDRLETLYPGMNWSGFCKTREFKQLKEEASKDLIDSEVKFSQLYDQCEYILSEICQINSKFKDAFQREINDTELIDGRPFKSSYRKSTHTSFNTLRSLLKENKKSGNRLNYSLAILVISHVFNHIFQDEEGMKKIFNDYFKEKNRDVRSIDYTQLRQWMTKATAGQLNGLSKQIIQLYFS